MSFSCEYVHIENKQIVAIKKFLTIS
jgi:hypothetical protein